MRLHDRTRASLFFFFNYTATPEIYTLSLHDALPIFLRALRQPVCPGGESGCKSRRPGSIDEDRKSTRLNSSHSQISYAVFCLKKKKTDRHAANPSAKAWTSFATTVCGGGRPTAVRLD